MHPDSELRTLRLWHWRKVVAARKRMTECEAKLEELAAFGRVVTWTKNALTRARTEWNTHMRAVQALNCVVTGTAEEDANDG